MTGRRYRYYISSRLRVEGRKSINGWRLPAEDIESLVIRQMDLVLSNQKLLSDWIVEHALHAKIPDGLQRAKAISTTLASALSIDQQRLVRAVIHRIIVASNKIVFEINPGAVVNLVAGIDDGSSLDASSPGPSDDLQSEADDEQSIYRTERGVTLARRGQGNRIVVDGPDLRESDDSLIDLIARSHYFLTRLTDGSCSSIKQLAAEFQIHSADISRILPLAFRAPSIVEPILAGNQSATLTPAYLRRGVDIPADWSEHRAALLQ